jgi:hypothetical protein
MVIWILLATKLYRMAMMRLLFLTYLAVVPRPYERSLRQVPQASSVLPWDREASLMAGRRVCRHYYS